ncbi:MAG TPA: OsmC family protein [Bacteroidales bacterium]|nr:OsmC family protein [Bacteroidales bacterium]
MEITFEGGKIVTALTHGHRIRTDQPVDNGGTDAAPSPFDLYLASIGTCAGVYVKSYCDNRQIPTEQIKIIQKTEFSPESGLPVKMTLDIQIPADFPEKLRDSLVHVAGLCKVKKSIANPPVFEIISTAH